VRNSLKNSVVEMAGDAYASDRKRLVLPEGELCNEMIVTRARLWGSFHKDKVKPKINCKLTVRKRTCIILYAFH
jgi:hypothetical protein